MPPFRWVGRRESVQTLRTSGWSLSVIADEAEFADFTEDMLAEMRVGAEARMRRALEYVVREVQWTLSKVYPAKGASGEERQPAPPGAPPGLILDELRSSWKAGRISWGKKMTVLTGRYFSRHPGAGALEWGSPAQKIPSHPYVRPTLVREADAITDILMGAE